MAKDDYLPKDLDDLDTWYENWLTNIGGVITALSLPGTHADTTKTAIVAARDKFSEWKNLKQTALAKSAEFQDTNKAAIALLRPYTQQLKNISGFTDDLGRSIGVIGPESTFNPSTAKPTVRGLVEGGGITIKFNNPKEVRGVRITSKRGDETSHTFLAVDTNSPYNDMRANLDPSKPEKREYILQFINKQDQIIGQPSDAFVITAPAGI